METDRHDLQKLLSGSIPFAFVAMDFDPSFDGVYAEAIAPGVQDAGLVPVRSDQVLSAGGVVASEIPQLIRQSRCVVADVTGSNPNVALEVGIAQANGKRLVYISQGDDVPFDLRHLRRIMYQPTLAGLPIARSLIAKTIRATLSEADALTLAFLWTGEMHRPITAIHGSPPHSHLATLAPSADDAYLRRLGASSSQTTGAVRLAHVYQRLALTHSLDSPEFKVADANGVAGPDFVRLDDGNLLILGGPAGNPVAADLMERMSRVGADCPVVVRSDDGTFRMRRGTQIYPADQKVMLARDHTDLGLLLRLRSPWRAGAFVWYAGGIRSFGTEAAIASMTASRSLERMAEMATLDVPGVWAIVEAPFDPNTAELIAYDIREAGNFDTRPGW